MKPSALGVVQSRIDSYVVESRTKIGVSDFKKEQAQIEADVRKVQTNVIAALKKQFQEGKINSAALFGLLLGSGVSPQLSSSIVSLEEITRSTKAETIAEREQKKLSAASVNAQRDAFLNLYKKGLMDEEQARTALKGLGLADFLIESYLSEAAASAVKAPKASTPGA